eukprot:3010170-Pleurochrysis_carterae.AAC.3
MACRSRLLSAFRRLTDGGPLHLDERQQQLALLTVRTHMAPNARIVNRACITRMVLARRTSRAGASALLWTRSGLPASCSIIYSMRTISLPRSFSRL